MFTLHLGQAQTLYRQIFSMAVTLRLQLDSRRRSIRTDANKDRIFDLCLAQNLCPAYRYRQPLVQVCDALNERNTDMEQHE